MNSNSRPVYSQFAQYYPVLFGTLDTESLRAVSALATPPALVLDIGCGTGEYVANLRELGYRAIGLDREIEMLRASTDNVRGVLMLGDLRFLPVDGVDLVLARGVLNDVLESLALNDALVSVFNALKPGGIFLADVRETKSHRERVRQTPVVERETDSLLFRSTRSMDAAGVVTSIEQFSADGGWSEPFTFKMRTFTEDEVRSLWAGGGFTNLEIRPSYGANSRLSDRMVVVARRS